MMGLKHAISTLVHRDSSPANETTVKEGTAAKSSNESFKSIRNLICLFVHRNDPAAAPAEENETEQDALTHRYHDLRRFPGGYQIVTCVDDDEPRLLSQPDASGPGEANFLLIVAPQESGILPVPSAA
ncbi:hypothetical protein DHEL01_v203197 [Diaporthe helianthi]|uniref:Uncharacterized protein n=1 Tax=Diaporthe helianthi TaxID=158607 RepID=A0A2P5I7E6_DIAHE|nr:hypothetical protein DHEL01_v203197 [Diaporthe helianthi]